MKFIENVPHVLATFNSRTALFMFDVGAGGVDVIFNGRSVDEFDLLNVLRPESLADLMGIGTSGPGLQVKHLCNPECLQMIHQMCLCCGHVIATFVLVEIIKVRRVCGPYVVTLLNWPPVLSSL